MADALAECQIRWPTVPIVFCETRSLAEEWTYRYLAAAWRWAVTEPAAEERTAIADPLLLGAPDQPEPTVAEVRAWARTAGLTVPDRGRFRPRELASLARRPPRITRAGTQSPVANRWATRANVCALVVISACTG